MAGRRGWAVAVGLGLSAGVAWPGGSSAAQEAGGGDLAVRIASAPESFVGFDVALREGVEVCDQGLRKGGDRWMWHGWDRRSGEPVCGPGPLRVVVERDRSGRVVDLEVGRLEDLRGRDARDLGLAAPDEAVAFLLGLARSDTRDDAVGTGMMVATLARGADPAPELLDLARDRSLDRDHRRSALFWVSQVAAERIGPHLAGIAADEAEDQDVRDAAVFALSQRPDEESVPALMDLARTAPHAGTRRSALFWLAQQDDPRVADFFAELILGGGGR